MHDGNALGGPGKAPMTPGGRVFMFGHWFYLTIIAATYTGALGPFLTSSQAAEVHGLDSLKDGSHPVVVRGPAWNVTGTNYKGDYLGGNGLKTTQESPQFKYLQSLMASVSPPQPTMTTNHMHARPKSMSNLYCHFTGQHILVQFLHGEIDGLDSSGRWRKASYSFIPQC